MQFLEWDHTLQALSPEATQLINAERMADYGGKPDYAFARLGWQLRQE